MEGPACGRGPSAPPYRGPCPLSGRAPTAICVGAGGSTRVNDCCGPAGCQPVRRTSSCRLKFASQSSKPSSGSIRLPITDTTLACTNPSIASETCLTLNSGIFSRFDQLRSPARMFSATIRIGLQSRRLIVSCLQDNLAAVRLLNKSHWPNVSCQRKKS